MSWPLASHFSAMLQNPRLAFRDPALQSCRIEKDAMNQPRPWSGSFAVVYKGTSAETGRSFAVRVFTTESPERRERYDQISEYLSARRLNCLVDFEYRDRAIRSASDGKFYPLILMDWVEGETLFHWARARCETTDAAALAALARRWIVTVQELADAGIAHGDIQHANVMVTAAGEIRLVDYDGMCVPALVGRRNLEVGIEPYQHPDRNPATLLGLELDRYSSIVIYTALRALAAAPELWRKHVEQTGNDKLLFRTEDLRSPAGSALCADLKNSPDPEVRELMDRLLEFTQGRMEQVPPLSQLNNAYQLIERLLRNQQWDDAVKLLNRRGRFHDAPSELKPLIREAYERVICDEAWQAFLAIPRNMTEQCDRELVRAWNEPLFAKLEAANAERPRVDAAGQRIQLLRRIARALRNSAGRVMAETEQLVATLGTRLPAGYHHSLQDRVALAQKRHALLRRLRSEIQSQTSESAIVDCWRALAAVGGEELVTEPAIRDRYAQAAARVQLLESLRALPSTSSPDEADRQILALWQADLLAGCVEADPWRPAYERAVRRAQLLKDLQQALAAHDDPAIAAIVGDELLQGYPLPAASTAVIEVAREREARCETLLAALRDGLPARFVESFDARLIRRGCERFRPFEPLIRQWLQTEILPLPQVGLAPAGARTDLAASRDRRGVYRIRWTWPPPHVAELCLVTICPTQPGPNDTPLNIEAVYRVALDRRAWDEAGQVHVLDPDQRWVGYYVSVWACVELGFDTLYSQPLVLGAIAERRGWISWLPFARTTPKIASSEAGLDRGPADDAQPESPGSDGHG